MEIKGGQHFKTNFGHGKFQSRFNLVEKNSPLAKRENYGPRKGKFVSQQMPPKWNGGALGRSDGSGHLEPRREEVAH